MIDIEVVDYADWRVAAWRVLRAGEPPERLRWRDADALQATLALGDAAAAVAADARAAPVPAAFGPLAASVARHADAQRWTLLYRLLWRSTHGEPRLLAIGLDDDARRAAHLAREVERDVYEVMAYVRFRRVAVADDERWIAWHRPRFRVLDRAAPFFVKRFGGQRWSILSPRASAHWDGAALTFGPGVAAASAVEDDVAALWRTYYESIFNPARPKPRAMAAQMPRRHWATLPETLAIPGLLAQAGARVAAMRAAQPPSAADAVPKDADWPTLRAAARGCRGCELCGPATATVFGEGPLDAALVLVGEQPGDEEDRAGRCFVGPAGAVLDAALADAGIDRLRAYLTNAVKHFRFQAERGMRLHRTPDGAHVNACRPWLEAEMALVRPRVIACLGATAAKAVLGRAIAVTRERGLVAAPHVRARVVATFHPAAVLRAPDDQRRAATRAALVADLRLAAALAAAP